MRTAILSTVTGILALAPALVAEEILPPPDGLKTGFLAIDEASAREWLSYLAGPECEGRGTGEPGFQRAAEYMAKQFRAMGLTPAGDEGTFFQSVPFTRIHVVPEATWLGGPGRFRVFAGDGLSVSRVSGDFRFEGEVVFLQAQGEDAALPEYVDLEGKAVVSVTRDTPRRFRMGLFRSRPALLISVTDELEAAAPRLRAGEVDASRGTAPRIALARDTARALARMFGVDPMLVEEPAHHFPTFRSAMGSGSLEVEIKARGEPVSVPNVVAMLPGSDPKVAHQYIGISGHLDHLGRRGDDVYFGADDDGSGCVAVMLVAKGLVENPIKPARSVVFMGFCGEEIGLVGSRHFAEHPVLPLQDMACLLNMDMVGRNEESENERAEDNEDTIHLVGSKRVSMELHELTLAANRHVGLVFEYDEEDVYRRSDHYNFARKGVPITFLFSGFHPDYHRPTDTVDKIEFDKIVRAARLNYLTAHMVAALDHLPKKDGTDAEQTPATSEAGSR